jgi:hypothetical protein
VPVEAVVELVEAVVELVETVGMTVFSVPSTSSGTACKVNAGALKRNRRRLTFFQRLLNMAL